MITDFDFAPQNKLLWQAALDRSCRGNTATHNDWSVRQRAVEFYLTSGGIFTGTRPSGAPDDQRMQLINNLSQRGVKITANLLARSLNHQWRQYIGHATVELVAADSPITVALRPHEYFGIRASAFGYEIVLPAMDRRIMIPRRSGYALMSLSRVLTIREARYRNKIPQ